MKWREYNNQMEVRVMKKRYIDFIKPKRAVAAIMMLSLASFATAEFMNAFKERRWSENQQTLYGWFKVLNDDQMLETITYLGGTYPDYLEIAELVAKAKKGWEGDCRNEITVDECREKIRAASLVPGLLPIKRVPRFRSKPSPTPRASRLAKKPLPTSLSTE